MILNAVARLSCYCSNVGFAAYRERGLDAALERENVLFVLKVRGVSIAFAWLGLASGGRGLKGNLKGS